MTAKFAALTLAAVLGWTGSAHAAGTVEAGQAKSVTCMACHGTGAGGAPKFSDVAAWADRIAKGADALHTSGLNGVAGTAMMAKGGCMNCSDEEVIAAVDFMVAGSQ